MTPHQGSGAGQAIEDAYILGSVLGSPSVKLRTLPTALKIYEEVRLPSVNDIQRRSAKTEMAWQRSFLNPICSSFSAAEGNDL